jgi:MinD-like ATPase involved in chromosome partitioning or flagellar assembly
VLSGKGGVGKSVIAFNLGERVAFAGLRVLVVDADATCGNVHILANIHSESGSHQFVRGELTLQETAVNVGDRLDILPVSGETAPQLPTAEDAVKMIRRLRDEGSQYDLIILDHSSGKSEPATVMAHGSDLSILVLVPELTSIADCYGLFKYLIEVETSIDCRLLLNRVSSMEEAEYIRGKFLAISERFLGAIPGELGALEESSVVRQSVARQASIAEVDSQSSILQSLKAIGNRLIDDLKTVNNPPILREEKTINKGPATADIKG